MPRHKQTDTNSSSSNGESAKLTEAQGFEYREILRSQINPAPYNPRSIDAFARKKLGQSLHEFKLVEPLVWNETTGNLCSGHQRISLIDEREGWPGKDYLIGVAVVKMPLKRETKLNVWLNNQDAQGHYDRDKFQVLLQSEEFKFEDFGFTMSDIAFEFGSIDGFEAPQDREERAAEGIQQVADELAKKRKETREKRNQQEAKADSDPKNDVTYYVLVSFDSTAEKLAWLREHRFPDNAAYLSIAEMTEAIQADGIRSEGRAA